MLKKISLSLIPLAVVSQVFAQQQHSISGNVKDVITKEGIITATITLTGPKTFYTVTDIDGNFTLPVDPGVYTLKVAYLGYLPKEMDSIDVTNASLATPINIELESDKQKNLKEVVINGSPKKTSINSLISYQKNANTIAQTISAEQISKSPDKNTGEALKRTPGMSLVDGKYLVVRGLNDRYNQAMANGALLSSTEADRKTFSFDIFPSGMVDNIIINKTATPDMPAEFAGGLIQINTKDIPTEDYFNVSLGSGSNTQAVGKDFYTYQGGKLDWLGVDDGTRKLPNSFPTKEGMQNMSASDRYEVAKTLSNNWSYDKKSTAPNANLQLSGGKLFDIKDKKFGVTGAINYNKNNNITQSTRTLYNQSGEKQMIVDYKEDNYSENVLAGALANFALELNPYNRISFKNIFNINSENNTLLRSGRNYDLSNDVLAYQLGFKSTKYLSNQLGGTHELPNKNLKINWLLGNNLLNENTPDLRRMEYRKEDGSDQYQAAVQTLLPSLSYASRFFSNLKDHSYTANADIAKKYKINDLEQSLKAGYFFQYKNRFFNSRPIGMVDGNQSLLGQDMNHIFSPDNIGPGKFNINELYDKDYDYDANSNLNSGFVMSENNINEKFKAVWGLRVENYTQTINGFRSNRAVNETNTNIDFLPSINLTYKTNNKTNLRLGASQTVIRPEFRELSPFAFYDFEMMGSVRGNPDLKRTKITNLDLRYEVYPKLGELITVGVFFKHFNNPIEQLYNETGVATSSFTYENASQATAFGAEIEFRKNLEFISPAFKAFTFFGNAAVIKNEVKFDIKNVNGEATDQNRPMQGQSPYLINGGLQYDNVSSGTTANVLFNVIGRRIYMVGNTQNPNIWEAPRPILDFQVAQQLMKDKVQLKLTVGNILNQSAKFYQDKNNDNKYNTSTDYLRISKLYGTSFSVSLAYKLK